MGLATRLSGLALLVAVCVAGNVTGAPPIPNPAAGRVFISPSGEPFRPTPGAPDPFEAWFAHADTNHDGKIDREEFRADAGRFFKQLDADNDGVIDGFEIAAYERSVAPELAVDGQGLSGDDPQGAPAVALLSEPEPVSGADSDLNSRINLAEWIAAADRRFDLLDKKKQGYLDHDALVALLPKPGKARRP